ncbi:hypothetical protein B0J18DRAFT_405592 [Chaetomium sp. MPI-SDFR-AT-0129]|nr:hypothetical protein B0J18DRAFT_405592 [Chaetomium sp. MPI-SDFR-AT-0129]
MSSPHRASPPAADHAMRVSAAARPDRPPARSATFPSSFSTSDQHVTESPSTPTPTADSIMAVAGPSHISPSSITRKRARTFEASYDGAADDEGHSKGGHSLRKRARVDYTQEMIDDELGTPTNASFTAGAGTAAATATAASASTAARNDAFSRPVSAPSSRNRKRKGDHEGSDLESEGATSNSNKRQRSEQPAFPAPSSSSATAAAPAPSTTTTSTTSGPAQTPGRPPSTRRRNPSKKLTASDTVHVKAQSDNEVQDTILVSVPNSDPNAPSDAEEEPSSPAKPELRLNSPNDSEAAEAGLTAAQPVTPQVTADVANKPNGEQLKPQRSPAPAPISKTSDAEVKEEQPTPKVEGETANLASPVEAQPASLTDDVENNRNAQKPAAEVSVSSEQPQAKIETSQPIPSPVTEPELASTIPPLSTPVRQPKPVGPSRFESLQPIYNTETPSAARFGLSPYEDEDIAYPGPYTEMVQPPRTTKGQSAAVPTPTPASVPLGQEQAAEFEWDLSRPLTTKEFFRLYRQEKQKREARGEPSPSMVAFQQECARRYKSVHANDPTSITASSSSSSMVTTESTTRSATAAKKTAQQPIPTIIAPVQNDEEIPDAQVSESVAPTAAPSPAAIDDTVAPEDGLVEGDLDVEEQFDDDAKSDGPGEPIEVTRIPSKQWSFPKIRDPSEFVDLLDGYQGLATDKLYTALAAVNEAMTAYQLEYNELRKLVDDEENAKRRVAYDKTLVNWENRQKLDEPLPIHRFFDEPLKGAPIFEVRGVRARAPYVDDPVLEHQKEEDRIMANAYHFKINSHPTQVGRQNPDEQRWEMPENRLRKRTEKGAELAEENVVEGKRARRPRHVSDQSKDVSRSGTPTAGVIPSSLGPGRRQRRRANNNTGAAADAGEDDPYEAATPAQLNGSVAGTPRKGRSTRGTTTRGAAGSLLLLVDEQDRMTPVAGPDGNQTEEDDEEEEEKPRVSRRGRARGAATVAEPTPTSFAAGASAEPTKTRRGRTGKAQLAAGNAQFGSGGAGEISGASFYGNGSAGGNQQQQFPDSRPSTASSEGTAHTAETSESTYSLRDKRKRNFALENDPELETRPQRRARVSAAQKLQDAAAAMAAPPSEPAKKRGQGRKRSAAQAQSEQQQQQESGTPSGLYPSSASRPASPPLAPQQYQQHQHQQQQHQQQQPVATRFYHNFVASPSVSDAGNGAQHQPAQTTTQQVGPYMHTFNAAPSFTPGTQPTPPLPPSIKKPITKLKLTNINGASGAGILGLGAGAGGASSSAAVSRASTPSNAGSAPASGANNSKPKRVRAKKGANAAAAAAAEAQAGSANGGDTDLEKPYAEMTKSEKMSWSMRRRWASGEMQGAVEKRRTTLAIKKAEKAAGGGNPTPEGDNTNGNGSAMTDSGSAAGPSDPTTPASMHGGNMPASGPSGQQLLALPQGPGAIPTLGGHIQQQPSQQTQGYLQQPYGYMPPSI